jgi:hypothetical protein
MYLIKKGSLYVAKPGSARSYTSSLARARLFTTRDLALSECCGNETVQSVESEFNG